MKKMFAMLLMLALTLCCAGAMAEDFYYSYKGVQLRYIVNPDGETVTVLQGNNMSAVIIPETATHDKKTYTVTGIGYEAFARLGEMSSVTIPSSVTSIGDIAFERCYRLNKVTFQGAVPPATIGNDAFMPCNILSKIVVPCGSVAAYEAALKTQFYLENKSCAELVVCEEHGKDCPIPDPPQPDEKIEENTAASADLPKTGDHSSLALWLALLGLAGAGMMMRRKNAA